MISWKYESEENNYMYLPYKILLFIQQKGVKERMGKQFREGGIRKIANTRQQQRKEKIIL